MTLYSALINALWLALFAYWMIAAIGAKRNVRTGLRLKGNGLRLGVIILMVLSPRMIPALRQSLHTAQAHLSASSFLGATGVVLCALGVGLALWARVHLGRHWGMPMSTKENPELVTTGPYAFVRHPIYTGILLAMLGTPIGENVSWVLPLILFGGYFVYSAKREEELMLRQFPEQYPAYMRRTSMLVPRMLGARDAGNSDRG
jgi:protein-S-isoprenylcysteine O-methyltransferase Ste14